MTYNQELQLQREIVDRFLRGGETDLAVVVSCDGALLRDRDTGIEAYVRREAQCYDMSGKPIPRGYVRD